MQPFTGHVVALSEEDIKKQLMGFEEKGYVPIPKDHQRAVKQVLKGKNEGYVSLTSGGKLSKFAAKKRKEKIAKNSRRKNHK